MDWPLWPLGWLVPSQTASSWKFRSAWRPLYSPARSLSSTCSGKPSQWKDPRETSTLKNRQEHSILNTTHCRYLPTQRGLNPQIKWSVTYKANLFSLLGLRHHDWIENHYFIEWWIFYQSLTWYYPVEVWAVGSHVVNASLYHIRVIYATISAITVHTNNQLICNSQSKHCIKPALPIKGNIIFIYKTQKNEQG